MPGPETASIAFIPGRGYIEKIRTGFDLFPDGSRPHPWNPLMATAQDLLSALAAAHSLSETGQGGDPEYVRALERVRQVQAETGWLVVRLEPEGPTARGEVIPDPNDEFGNLLAVLEGAGIQEMRFQEVMDSGVLGDFLRRLHPSSVTEGMLPSARFRGLEDGVGLSFRESRSGLPGMSGAVQDLFQPPVAPAFVPSDATEPVPAPSAPDAASSSTVRALSPDLVEEVGIYLGSRDLARVERGQRLREEAAILARSRNVAALGEMVRLLAESADAGSGDDQALELVREITTPALASYFVARLGAVRDEEERHRLTQLISLMGREGALALADALGESLDRSERRAFLDALVTLGPLAFEMAQRLVSDPRWFVVRNGVAVLGELGGEGAVAHITSALANGDGRVRKEAILSLAKIGGTDAETHLLGMLDDGDAPVRGAACRALGALRTEGAFRPLLQRLKDPDAGVQAEAIQALGQIGGPEAVRFIEKKAVGGMFSRPPQEVRIAAFQALAKIGTFHALKVLEKGAKDRDSAVANMVKALTERS
jgi:HEAT repeat protein